MNEGDSQVHPFLQLERPEEVLKGKRCKNEGNERKMEYQVVIRHVHAEHVSVGQEYSDDGKEVKWPYPPHPSLEVTGE